MSKKVGFVLMLTLVFAFGLTACNTFRETAEKNKTLNETLPFYKLNGANFNEVSYAGMVYNITDDCLTRTQLQEEIGQVSRRFKNVEGKDFSFGYVYSIMDVDVSDAVAVNINNEYRRANIKYIDEKNQ